MKTFTTPPWKPSPMSDPATMGGMKPADWFVAYQKMKNPEGKRPSTTPHAAVGGLSVASNFVQTELNPGVAFDKTTKKFRILLMDNGTPIPRGSFWTDDSGMIGYSGFNDMANRGPMGIAGVPLSVGNMGPPGAAILPRGHWQNNRGMRHPPLPRPSTCLLEDKGQWTTKPPYHCATCARPDLPAVL